MPIVSKVAQGECIKAKGSGYRSPSDIRWIIPHHLVAHWTAMYAAKYFLNNGLDNSVNYCIGYDGSCVCGLYEDYGAWTSSNALIDHYSITIECSDTSVTDYTIPAMTKETLIELMVDLIQRYQSLGGKAIYDPSDASEVMQARREKRLPKTKGNVLIHKWTSGGTTSCPGQDMIDNLPAICAEVNRRLDAQKTKKDKLMDALAELGDGRYKYYDGSANSVGCSKYLELALKKAGIIKEGETFHALSGNVGVLADTTRFEKIPWSANNLQRADIMWSNGHHVATWDGSNGVWEAAPEQSHGLAENGKTGVGHFPNHTYYNCGTGTKTWTCLYRIRETAQRTLREEAQYMIDNGITEPARSKQAIADGFEPKDVQAEIDRMLGKNTTSAIEALIAVLPTLKKGMKVAAVYVLQAELANMGYYPVEEIDGSFGDKTESALKDYQRNINIVYGNFKVDGICGTATWERIFLNK